MSTNDKTGDQLANTIRKAKTGTAATQATASAAKPAAPVKKAPAKKAAPAKKKAARPAAKNTEAPQPASGSFKHSRRVWPD